MTKKQLEEYRNKLALLSKKEKELRDKYLKKFYDGTMQGPLTGLASIDEPWLKKPIYEVDLPDVNQTAYSFLYECNKDYLDDTAIIYDPIIDKEPIKITFREFFKKIDETAKAYIAYGIRKGDIVTVSLPSFVENIVNFYALNKIGAVANQIHPLASQDEIEFYLDEAESKIFIGHGDVLEKIKKIKNDTLEHVVLVSAMDSIPLKEEPKTNVNENSFCMSWKEFIEKGKEINNIDEYINNDPTSLATLTHTSGTTGKSKGVMTDSKSFNYSMVSIQQVTSLFKRHDKEMLILPPFPLYFLNNVVHFALCSGEELIVIPKVDYDNLSIYFKKHNPQHVKGIPSTPESMLKDEGFKDYDMSNFKFLISGGGKLNCEDDINKFLREHNCKYDIANGYGMSEGGGAISCMFDRTIEKGTVGSPLYGSGAKAIDLDTGEELSYLDDKNGELLLTGPSIMLGYYKNKEATDELFYRESDGSIWLRTGDLGRITEEGNIKLVGRLKRMTFVFDSVNNTASKVSHDYMETILCKNKNVEDALVVAVPDKISEHAFKAYLSLRNDNYDETISELDKTCKVTFREYISPIEYIVINGIPKTGAGKNDFRYLESYEQNPEKEKDSKIKVLYRKGISER